MKCSPGPTSRSVLKVPTPARAFIHGLSDKKLQVEAKSHHHQTWVQGESFKTFSIAVHYRARKKKSSS